MGNEDHGGEFRTKEWRDGGSVMAGEQVALYSTVSIGEEEAGE